MSIQPFYLVYVPKFEPSEQNPTPIFLAAIPLFSYILGMLFSMFIQRRLTEYLKNRMYLMLIAVLLTVISSIPLAFLDKTS